MPTTAEGATGRRRALVVATGSYADTTLAKLQAPGRDASDLAAVLQDATVGGFEVEMVLDAPAESLRRRVARFCAQTGPGDLVLVYLSCHGVLDDRGRLYYAAVDTDRALLSATALSSAWLNEQLEDCRSRRQILVLDCCHSGAFAKGAKGESGLALGERFEGRGRIVLTGSRATEYSFEHGRVVGDSVSSVFTSALVKGLRSGEADRDGDGVITIGELYDYAYETVRAREARQTPTLWTYGAEGDLLVAHSPRGAIIKPAPLPEDLVALLESPRARVREGAVRELADLLHGPDAGRALTARAQLERIAAEDLPSVAVAARAALDAAAAAPSSNQPQPPRTGAPPQPPPPPKRDESGQAGPPSPNRRRMIAIAAGAGIAAVIAIAVALLAGGGRAPSAPSKIALSGSPRGIAVGEGATWVTRYDYGQVSRIDRSSAIESIDVGPHPSKIAAGEGSVWVSVDNGKRLVRIDPTTHKVTKGVTIDTEGCKCPATELAIAQETLWVGSLERRAIMKFDPVSGEQLGEPFHPGPGFKGVFTVDENAVWAVGTDNTDPAVSWVIRMDIRTGTVKRIPLRRDSYFSGVAYGRQTLWIADAANVRNFATAFDPSTERVTANVKITTGIADDDIAVTGKAVIVWNTWGGWLTRIDADKLQVVRKQKILRYQTSNKVNLEWSDLAVDGDFAWVTEPAGNAVYKVTD